MRGPAADVVAELSASEEHNVVRCGCSVAESIVGAYALGEQARSLGVAMRALVFDIGAVEVQRVAQLVGALIDAGCGVVVLHNVSDDREPLLGALQAARISDDRVKFG